MKTTTLNLEEMSTMVDEGNGIVIASFQGFDFVVIDKGLENARYLIIDNIEGAGLALSSV